MYLVIKYVKGRNPLMSDLQEDANVESDCDEDIPEVQNELQNPKEEKKETRAVLITGSFSAYAHFNVPSFSEINDGFFSWKSLFFYRCTDVILFAPLKSQGVESRLNFISNNTVAELPPPCSPKSIYVLAKLVK